MKLINIKRKIALSDETNYKDNLPSLNVRPVGSKASMDNIQ